jgi:hypothetical protein
MCEYSVSAHSASVIRCLKCMQVKNLADCCSKRDLDGKSYKENKVGWANEHCYPNRSSSQNTVESSDYYYDNNYGSSGGSSVLSLSSGDNNDRGMLIVESQLVNLDSGRLILLLRDSDVFTNIRHLSNHIYIA